MIALVRHGAYAIRTGSLTDEGRAQALDVAKHLCKTATWNQVIASPSVRTRETAEIISQFLNIPMTLDERLAITNGTEERRASIQDNTIYVSHWPVLHALVPDWEPKIGEVRIIDNFKLKRNT